MLWKQIIVVSILTVMFGSCDDPNELGMNLLPTSDIIQVGSKVEKNSNKAYTLIDDTIRTSIQSNESKYILLGSMNDPVFGKTTIDYAFQLRLEYLPRFGENPVADSIFLFLYYNNFWGDTTTIQKLRIYELESSLNADQEYFHTEDLSSYAAAQPFTEFEYHPVVEYDTTSTDSSTLKQLIKIPLDFSLAQKLMAIDTTNMINNDIFLQHFKGLYIQPEVVNSEGSIIQMEALPYSDLGISDIVLYYHNDTDTSEVNYFINKYSARINSFKHDYTQTSFYNKIGKETVEDSLIYIQPTAGLKSKVYLPSIDNWIDSSNVVINRALVVFQIDSIASEMETYEVPQQLWLYAINDDGTFDIPYDYAFSPEFYGGTFNPYLNTYTFNITQHFKNIIREDITNNGFYLKVAGPGQHANRVILKGSSSSVGIKLIVTYSKLSL